MSDIDIRIDRGLRFRLSDLSKRELRALLARFEYPNPIRARLQRMGKYVGHLEKQIKHYELTDDELILPRGGGEKVDAWAAEVGRDPWWIDDRTTVDPFVFEPTAKAQPIELRDDQLRLIDAFLERENALIRAAPGAGKSEVVIETIRRLQQPTLIIVWSKGLLDQWVNRIAARWGWPKTDIGIVGNSKRRVRPLTIAMQQTLDRPGVAEELADEFGFVVVDEVQRASSRTLRESVRKFSARWRLGVSADERRKDKLDVLITDNFGAVVAEVKRGELIARGDLCEVDIIMVSTDVVSEILEATPTDDRSLVLQQRYGEIIGEIIDSDRRVEQIASIAIREIERGESVLIFSDRVEYARRISRRIVERGHRCGLMIGGADNRQAFRESAEKIQAGTLRCAVGTSAVYQGIDIPRLSVGIVATPTASNAQLIEQQVGRVRRKYPGKLRGRVYYIWDEQIFPRHRELLTRVYGRKLVSIEE